MRRYSTVKKQLSLIDDEGQRQSDCRKKPGSFPKVHLFPTTAKSMHKGCKIYAILVLNENGWWKD
jgi:hypothetical protein